MTMTKRTIISQAYAEIGLGRDYDAQPDELQDALLRLNAIFMQWATAGVAVGFPAVNVELADDLDNNSNLPGDAVRTAICALALDLAPSFGKAPLPQTVKAASEGYKLLMRKWAAQTIPTRARDLGSVPAGAGHKYENRINLVRGGDQVDPTERQL